MNFRLSKSKLSNMATVFAVFAITAILVRAIIPQGFMFEADADGKNGVRIVLCTAQGELNAIMNSDGSIDYSPEHKGSNETNSENSGHCLFAVALQAIDFDNQSIAIVSVEYSEFYALNRNYLPSVGLGLAAPPPPKTGPPTII